MKKVFSGFLDNPLGNKQVQFAYEVIEQSEVVFVEYQDDGYTHEIPECKILIRSFTGWNWLSEQFICTISGKDAQKHLRPGEFISADLTFRVRKKDDDTYEQIVSAENVYTLNDYFQIREAEAAYEGRFIKEQKDAD